MLRDKNCNELRLKDVNSKVRLCGWVNRVRNLGSLCFVDLRDTYGITQLNIPQKLFEESPLHPEDCIQAEGIVRAKQEANKLLDTGEVELEVTSLKVFAHSQTPPFTIEDNTNASEETRLKYRYLDLRRPKLQKYLKTRHEILKVVRNYLEKLKFNEVCTPTLIKSTPEGARDYLVPSRIYKGCFYALPQSPQIYKQLLMISGFDKYYQIALCYRDEDQRADRQPEFVQIDCEMSFVQRDDVLKVIEGLLSKVFLQIKNVKLPKFTKISYSDAINKYGTDKPDLRFDMQILEITKYFKSTGFEAYKGKTIRAIVVKNYADHVSRKNMDTDNELVKQNKLYGVSHIKIENNVLTGGISKFIDEETQKQIISDLTLENNDLIIIGADKNKELLSTCLGLLRIKYGDLLNLRDKDKFAPCFVVDWPMFEKKEDGTYECLANPFTRPIDKDLKYLKSNPTKVKSYSYDTVINGVELSSGALRIYDGEVQKQVFDLLGFTPEDIDRKFGFFIDSFNYGTPPMGGFGIGLERLCMVINETDNVRDVVAFPKNLNAYCPMAKCPSKVDDEAVDILGLDIKKEYK